MIPYDIMGIGRECLFEHLPEDFAQRGFPLFEVKGSIEDQAVITIHGG